MRNLLLALLVCAACLPGDLDLQQQFDGQAPTILAVQSGLRDLDLAIQPVPGVSTTDSLQLFFSESMDPSTIQTSTVVLVEGVVDDGFLSDINSPPLIDSRAEIVHPVSVTLAPSGGNENAAIVVSPLVPLKEQTLYTLVLSSAIRDANGSPLVDATGLQNAFTFTLISGNTVDGSPIASLAFPTPAAGQTEAQNVPTNLPRAVVLFTKPVLGVLDNGVNQNRIVLLGSGDLPVAATLVDGKPLGLPECATAALSQCFSLNLQAQLAPNATQQVVLSPGITDVLAQPLVGQTVFRFSTGAGPDITPPTVIGAAEVLPQDDSAGIAVTVDEASTATLRFGTTVANTQVSMQSTNLGNGQFRHQATIVGLLPETNYVFEVLISDFAGNTLTIPGSFSTAPRLPQLLITEAMANPQSSSEATEEFVEVFNADVVPIDLNGMTFHEVQGGVNVTNFVIGPRAGGSTVLQPGQFGLIVGSSFAPTNISVSPTAIVVQTSANAGLNNSTDQSYRIESGGFAIATFQNKLVPDCNGRSIEMIDLDLGDATGNFAYSSDPSGATPGRENSGSTDQSGNTCF